MASGVEGGPESSDLAVVELESDVGEYVLQFPGDGGDLVQFEPFRMNEESGVATGAKVLAVIPWSLTAEEQTEHPLWKLQPGFQLEEINGVACWDMDFRDILQCTRNAMDGGLPRPLTLKFRTEANKGGQQAPLRRANFRGFRGIRASVSSALGRRGRDPEDALAVEDVAPGPSDASPSNGHAEHARRASVANRLGQTFRRVHNRLRSRGDAKELETLERVKLARELSALLAKIYVEPFEPGAEVLAVRSEERTIGDGQDAAVVECVWSRSRTGKSADSGYSASFYSPNSDDLGELLSVETRMIGPSENDVQLLMKLHEEDKEGEDPDALRAELLEIAGATGAAQYGPMMPSARLLEMYESFVSFVKLWDGICHTHSNVTLVLRSGSRKPIVLGFTRTEVIVYEKLPQLVQNTATEEDLQAEKKYVFLAAESENTLTCGKVITRLRFDDIHVRCDPLRDDAFVLAVPNPHEEGDADTSLSKWHGVPMLASEKQTRDVLVLGIRALRARAGGSTTSFEEEDPEDAHGAAFDEQVREALAVNKAAFESGLDYTLPRDVIECSREAPDIGDSRDIRPPEILHPAIYAHLAIPSQKENATEGFTSYHDEFGEIFNMAAQSTDDYGFNPVTSIASQLAFTNEEIDELRSQVKKMKTELSVSQNDRSSLRERLRSLQEEDAEKASKIAELEASLKTTLSEKELVSHKLEEHGAIIEEREDLKHQVEVLQGRLVQMNGQIDAANHDKERLATELAAAREAAAAIDQATKERDDALADSDAKEQELRIVKEQMAELQEQLKQSQLDARDANQASEDAVAKLKRAEENAKTAENENRAAQEKAEQLQQQRNGLKRKADSLARELDHITKVVGSVEEAEKKLAEFDKTRLDLAIAQAERRRAEDDAKELANVVEEMRVTIEGNKRTSSMVKSQLSKAGDFLRRSIPRPDLGALNGSDASPGAPSSAHRLSKDVSSSSQAKAGP